MPPASPTPLPHPKYVFLALAVFALVALVRVHHRDPPPLRVSAVGAAGPGPGAAELRRPIASAHTPADKGVVSDEPAERFRDNLLPGRAYITAGHSFGSSNQVLSHIRMITLALRLDRIPIVDTLYGGEHGEGSELPLSTFYDLARLSQTISLPIVEWPALKRTDSAAVETLVCWQDYLARDVASASFAPFNVTPAFWPIPRFTYDAEWATLASLEALALRSFEAEAEAGGVGGGGAGSGGPTFDILRAELEAQGKEVPASLPDQQVLCFDQFFFVLDGTFVNGHLMARPDGARPNETQAESIEQPSVLGRSWLDVGQHLHFAPAFAATRDAFLASVLGHVAGGGHDYIAVHVRQGDFLWYSRVGDKLEGPFTEAVEEVRRELHAKGWTARAPGWAARWRKPLPVVFATDSEDEAYIAALKAHGWHYLDHKAYNTVERFGSWYPSMLDQAVLSNAVGFVGTEMSTFSALARNRVLTWQDGVARMTGAPIPGQAPGA